MSRYPVPGKQTRVEYQQGNSRFIATVGRAASVDEARAFIQSIRDAMPGATHHVYAMKVGYSSSVTEGVSDDGEPSGTSGPPILSILRGADLGDVVLVVTRYFGGTKLGTGGLVTAYSTAAKEVLAQLPVEEKIDRIALRLEVPYPLYERVRQLLGELEGLIEKEDFAEHVSVSASIPEERRQEFKARLADLTAGRITPHFNQD